MQKSLLLAVLYLLGNNVNGQHLSDISYEVTPTFDTAAVASFKSPQLTQEPSAIEVSTAPKTLLSAASDSKQSCADGTNEGESKSHVVSGSCTATESIVVQSSDEDEDGVLDNQDQCAGTGEGEAVDEIGCSSNDYISRDKAALIALYEDTGGSDWKHNSGWSSPQFDDHCSWYGVGCDDSGRVTRLKLNSNRLKGQIPSELGNLSSLRSLYLDNNQLTGNIPAELGDLASLWLLSANSSQLTGGIPSELGNLSSLAYLYLERNRLTGNIPIELGNLLSLNTLNLSQNRLTGSIPSELGNLSSLWRLNLYTNSLTGSIPSELGNLSSLRDLRLRGNQLTGSIPSELGNLSSLENLYLNDNQLTGSIPSEVGNLSSLKFLNLSYNQLSGSIPSELVNLSSMYALYLQNNELSGIISESLGDFIVRVSERNLNNNRFWCPLPSALNGRLDCVTPAAPSEVVIEQFDYTDGAITLTVSASEGDSAITSYDATCTDGTNIFVGTSSTPSITVSGLTNGVAYTCSVTATNEFGTSIESDITEPITPSEGGPNSESEITSGHPNWLFLKIIEALDKA